MTPGFAGFRSTKNPIFQLPESDTVTKRDTQASEYAAESYEQTPTERGVSHMSWALTEEEREAIKQAIGIVDWHKAYFSHMKHDEPLPSATLRKLLERTK